MNATATDSIRFTAVRLAGRWKVEDAATGETVTCASRAKAEERAAKLNAAEERAGSDRPEHRPENLPATAPLEVVTLDGEETTVLVEETPAVDRAQQAIEDARAHLAAHPELVDAEAAAVLAEEAPELTPAELAAKIAAEAEEEGRYADSREARAAELAERVNAGEMTFDEAAALLITERGAAPAPAEKAEPMKSLWVAAAFVPIILADAAPERATLVAKLDASVPNNRGGRTVRLTRAEAEELAAIGTEIENSVNGAGRMAHSARTMRDRLAALWA
jgi:predicted DNA binding protein